MSQETRISAALLMALILLTGCSDPPSAANGWTAFVYPDIENIPDASQVQNYTIGTFRNFDTCQQAAIDRVRFLSAESERQADYMCGYGCRYRPEYANLLICKEKRK